MNVCVHVPYDDVHESVVQRERPIGCLDRRRRRFGVVFLVAARRPAAAGAAAAFFPLSRNLGEVSECCISRIKWNVDTETNFRPKVATEGVAACNVERGTNATTNPFLGGGLGHSPPAAGVGEDAEVDEERDEAEEGAAHAGGANRVAEADLVQGLQKKQHMSVFSWPCPAPTTRNILSLWSAPTSVAIIIYHFATFCQM